MTLQWDKNTHYFHYLADDKRQYASVQKHSDGKWRAEIYLGVIYDNEEDFRRLLSRGYKHIKDAKAWAEGLVNFHRMMAL